MCHNIHIADFRFPEGTLAFEWHAWLAMPIQEAEPEAHPVTFAPITYSHSPLRNSPPFLTQPCIQGHVACVLDIFTQLSFDTIKYIYYLHLPDCVRLCEHMACVCRCSQRSEEGVRSPGAGVLGNVSHAVGYRELSWGSPQDWVFFIDEPYQQFSPSWTLWRHFCCVFYT